MGEKWYDHPAFPSERFQNGLARIDRETDALLESLGYRHDRENACYLPINPTEERIALFAHHGFGMAFLASLLDLPYPMVATHFDMCHSGMTVIDFRVDGEIVIPKLLQLSGDSHLYRDGLPTYYNRSQYI